MSANTPAPKPRVHRLTAWVSNPDTPGNEALLVRHEPEGHEIAVLNRAEVLWARCPSNQMARAATLELALAAVSPHDDDGAPRSTLGLEVRARSAAIIESAPGRLSADNERARKHRSPPASNTMRASAVMVAYAPSMYFDDGDSGLEETPEGRATWQQIREIGADLIIVSPSVNALFWAAEGRMGDRDKGYALRETLHREAEAARAGIIALTQSATAPARSLELAPSESGNDIAFTYRAPATGHYCRWTWARAQAGRERAQ